MTQEVCKIYQKGTISAYRTGRNRNVTWQIFFGAKQYTLSELANKYGILPKTMRNRIAAHHFSHVAVFMDGHVEGFRTARDVMKFCPDPISPSMAKTRLLKGVPVDAPFTKKEKKEAEKQGRNNDNYHRRKELNSINSIERAKRYEVGNAFASLPRPKGMTDRPKEWTKPAF